MAKIDPQLTLNP